MVPVLDRPVMAHILDLLDRHGFDETIANLHYFPDSIREHFGERLSYRYEEELLGTAGGVRACSGVLRRGLVSGDLGRRAHRHRPDGARGQAPSVRRESRRWPSRRCRTRREYGVVLHDREGRITGFQEKPHPDEALSDLGNCGIYVFTPRDIRLLPGAPVRRLGQGRVPGAARRRRAVSHPRGARVLERRRLAGRAAPGHVRRAARRAAPGGRGRGGLTGRRARRGRARCRGRRGRRSGVDRPGRADRRGRAA